MEAKNTDGLTPEISKLIREHPSLEVHQDGNKLKCALTGHEMRCKVENINAYVNGKKYKRISKISAFDYEKYKPHIVPSEKKWFKDRKQLFCKLTLRHLNQDPHHVLRHVNGKRFKKALVKWEECQRTGEVFKPRGGSRNLKKTPKDESDDDESSGEEEEEEEGDRSELNDSAVVDEMLRNFEEDEKKEGDDDEDSDSLADLYPEEDFKLREAKNTEPESDDDADQKSDSEFEDDEEIPEAKPAKKRKAPVPVGKETPSKKLKAKPKSNKKKKKSSLKTK